jgi:mRNA interferase MazF
MRRGELYRVRKPGGDPKRSRVLVVVSRQVLLDSSFSTVVCAPVYSEGQGLSTQVPVGMAEGLKHESSIFCDNLVSIPRSELTDYVGSLSPQRMSLLNRALRIALELV